MGESRIWLSLLISVAMACSLLSSGCDEEEGQLDSCSNLFMDGRESDIDCGGPDCPQCQIGAGCYEVSDCVSGNCNCGQCRELNEIDGDGVRNGPETDVDCGGGCAGCAEGLACVEDSDCDRTLALVCRGGVCVTPGCTDGAHNGDETDVDCGGGTCPPCGHELGCRESSDCCSGFCDDNECVEVTCADRVHNGYETDVDCGGADAAAAWVDCGAAACEPCADGLACLVDSDCENEVCTDDGEGGLVCQGPTCFDSVHNGEETDVDCGGPDCECCDIGDSCVDEDGGDCCSGVCHPVDHTCQAPSCEDDVMNGDETDVDCGGSCPCCDVDADCSSWSDCCSGFCSDAGKCRPAGCNDRVHNGDETDVDCGGSCDCCDDLLSCSIPADCCSSVCEGGSCVEAACDDGVSNGDETGVDCGGTRCDCCPAGQICEGNDDCCEHVCDLVFTFTCLAPACDDGTHNGDETDVDCGGPTTCDRCDVGGICAEWGDCASGYCTAAGTCALPTCADGVLNGDEVAIDCGGSCPCCDDLSYCAAPEDCCSNVCVDNACVAPACDDGVHNADETGVDCGGPRCDCCPPAQECDRDTDCCEGVCDLVFTFTCLAPACDDTVHNGDETDVDCGGPTTCDRCDIGRSCVAWDDCESGYCSDFRCVAALCTDGVQNGGETDVDCGGATACNRCDPGEVCLAHSDCLDSGYCGPAGLCIRGITCQDLLDGRGGSHPDGPYDLDLDPDGVEVGVSPSRVYCDMETDDRAWTLVASTRGTTLNDDSGFWHAGLSTIFPTAGNEEVWIGMLGQLNASNHCDIRFSCRTDPAIADFEVDIAFYDNPWYWWIARSVDSGTSWSPLSGGPVSWMTPAPTRRDLIRNPAPMPATTADWSEPFYGEWSDDDLDSFTVDLNGPGMTDYRIWNQTSWGEASVLVPCPGDPPVCPDPRIWESEPRCGTIDVTTGGLASWYIWVHELP